MEPFIGFVMGLILLGVVIPIYHRFFAAEGARNREFERWCRTKPVVMALRCAPEDTIDVYDVVRREIESKKEVINSSGRFPWQHYVFTVDCWRVSGTVIVLKVTGCRPAKLRDNKHHDLARSIDAIGRATSDRVEEVWFHGQLQAVRRVLGPGQGHGHDTASWLGEFDAEGHATVTGMIGQPPWLVETLAQT